MEVWNFFLDMSRENLHVVLCLSPVGDAFRERLRQFPSLVNCCTINWCVCVRARKLIHLPIKTSNGCASPVPCHAAAAFIAKLVLMRACLHTELRQKSAASASWATHQLRLVCVG